MSSAPKIASGELTETDHLGEAAIDRRSLNLPNFITLLRFLLSLVLFALMDLDGWWRTSAAVFIVAASTDFLDGYLARKYGQITTLGRIMDPFVDKLIICGAFLFLLGKKDSGISPWVAFIVMAREMFITSLRAFLEQHGRDFSAKFWGKLKMLLQCIAVPMCLLSLSPDFARSVDGLMSGGFEKFIWLRNLSVALMAAVTVYSGLEYSWRAFRVLRRPGAIS
ncbi:CDP-diacylglycerol--glycerol-3-phosphate 3-phosphatidyltransferase [Caulifigura coniformis]|uniref:CDP-diacylglycerol--glycerol-3-phosphate 3-phosphatidyltransferase n=1 Tax=Caulifigura coniformis TaxID=2527983 RepID=A0A517S7F5_9PLAN|nr:CDP-diacylglycerol--glycerol-3-phosphate 3-phosphatidyltransferase [Caulifigura coniformis]QDT52052.1 CDP-diacylglycerol--glycerol-3-phosphate 3-phosphatidyltransferase [Caulifigura coniformis]